MKYKYTAIRGLKNINGRTTKRPIVMVQLSKGNQKRDFFALIDSGADQISMPAYIAELFGIREEDAQPRSMMGITMQAERAFVGDLEIQIQDQQRSFAAPVVFVHSEMPIVLGRETFFDRYRIKFEQDHDTFDITPALK